jgi:hypothetical protein
MMDKKLKMKWVKALESGKFKQGKERLSAGGYYCCLGVLREIAFKGQRCSTLGDYSNLLNPEIQREAGLTKRTQQALAAKNDVGETFKEIAAWIRKHL